MTEQIQKGWKIGPYEIIAPLGKGGMASVYRAYQPALDREVAIKLIAEQYANDATFAERFRREARSVARLHHPNILTIYDFGEQDKLLYIVMELIDGPTLKDEIDNKPLPVDKAIDYTRQVAAALDYANKNGIIHRDVKPSNVLIDKSGRAVLSDFGIAKMTQANTQLTSTGTGIGTPDYMSPEQALGDPLDSRSDEYSLGVMLYEMLTGRTPFQGDTPIAIVMGHVSKPLPPLRSLNPQIPPSVEKAVEKALSKKATDRYDTNADFSKALEEAWRNRDTPATDVINRPIGTNEEATQQISPVARPGSGPYIPEAEQLYAEARRQEAQNNFYGAFAVFNQIESRFPRYRDVPSILDRYRTMGYGQTQQATVGWQAGTGSYSPPNTPPPYGGGQYGGTSQFGAPGGYSGPVPTIAPAMPVRKKGAPVGWIIFTIVLVAIVAVFAIIGASGGGKTKTDLPQAAATSTAVANNAQPTTTDEPTATDEPSATDAPTTAPAATAAPKPTTAPAKPTTAAAKPTAAKTDVPPTSSLFKVVSPPAQNATPKPADTGAGGKYKTYNSQQGTWSAEIPDTWQAEEDSDTVTLTPADNSGATIVVTEADVADLNADAASNFVKDYLKGAGGTISDESSRKIDGIDTKVANGKITQSGIDFNFKLANVTKNNKLYLVFYLYLPALGNQFDGTFNHFADTFKAIK